MPAAFYEFNIEQGSDFVSSVKVMKPGGGIFRFIPKANQSVWSGSTLNIDIPEEIKLIKPTATDAFGWLQSQPGTFLTIRSKVKTNQGVTQIEGTRTYSITTVGGFVSAPIFTPNPATKNIIEFNFVPDNTEYNVTMRIPSGTSCGNNNSAPSGTTCYNGKYLYDIELEYDIGATPATKSKFVIRLLQGRMTFNPNITT